MLHGSIKKWGTRCEVYDHWTAQVFCPISLWQPVCLFGSSAREASRQPATPLPRAWWIYLACDRPAQPHRSHRPSRQSPAGAPILIILILSHPTSRAKALALHSALHQAWVLLLRELSGSMSCPAILRTSLCTSHCHSWLMMRHVNQTLVSLCVPVNGNGYDTLEIHFPPPYVGSTSTKLQY